jgi:hypothetical protein
MDLRSRRKLMKAILLAAVLFFCQGILTSQVPANAPPGLEILKHSWTTAAPTGARSRPASGITNASERTPERPDVYPNTVKGEAGEKGLIKRVPDPKSTAAKVEFITITLTLTVRNTGTKTIEKIGWHYRLLSNDPAAESITGSFETKARVLPGKKARLQEATLFIRNLEAKQKLPSHSSFMDEIIIVHVGYADGSSWDSGSTTAK